MSSLLNTRSSNCNCKCTIDSLVYQIDIALPNLSFLFQDMGYRMHELRESDYFAIQNLLLSKVYKFKDALYFERKFVDDNEKEDLLQVCIGAQNLSDDLVLLGLGFLLISQIVDGKFDFHSKNYCTYKYEGNTNTWIDCLSTIQTWSSFEALLYIDCANSILTFNRERVLEKVNPIIDYDEYLLGLIEQFTNCYVIDEMDRNYIHIGGIPPYPLLGNVLFNIIIDDIDREIQSILPNLTYVRYQHKFFIPFAKVSQMNVNTSIIYKIFEKHQFRNLISKTAFKLKGGSETLDRGNDISFSYLEYDPFGLALCVDINKETYVNYNIYVNTEGKAIITKW